MKKSVYFVFYLFLLDSVYSQNNFEISLQYASGNSSWLVKPLKVTLGDTTIDLISYANCPTFSAQIQTGYNINKHNIGAGFEIQHFFVRDFITQGTPQLGIPTTFATLANTTPTHFKFSINYGYSILKQEKIEILPQLQLGTFIDDYNSGDTTEGFHWFGNINIQTNYSIANNTQIFFAPGFDYARLNTTKDVTINDQRIWINIYSFYFSAGVKYNFTD